MPMAEARDNSQERAERELQLERWDEREDGPLSEENMKHKLTRQGFHFKEYTFPPGASFIAHYHTYDKKTAVLTGQFVFQTKNQKVLMKAGDIVLIPKYVPHKFHVVGQRPVVLLDATSQESTNEL